MQLTPVCLMLSCLRVSPDRSQFSRYDSISLSCEDLLNSMAWKVKRNTSRSGVTTCTFGWGSNPAGSTCFIGNIYPSDSGTYWCESDSGERSNTVNITITERPVILISPALPVPEGAGVTLGCRHEADASVQRFHFYKDGRSIGSSSSTGEFTRLSVSKSDEGLYTCGVPRGGESVGSWLAVEAPPPPPPPLPSSSPSPALPALPCPLSVSRLLCHLMAGAPYLLSTILLGLIVRDRKRAARTDAERGGGDDVVMETVA
ncbi:Fc receptor-like protein 5 [Labrus bergylta]|uniref:Fc receptor-like protein 5 n=1 Tax=Labrus bergylta TaxID=56723 RepID=UPI003313C5A7